MKYNILIILLAVFSFYQVSGQVTVGIDPQATDCGQIGSPIGLLGVDQSTTDGNHHPERAIDGVRNGRLDNNRSTKTQVENNPYFQVNLESQSTLSEIVIYYPSDILGKGASGFYILISDYPFETSNLSETISSPLVEFVYVEDPIESGVEIPLNNKSGRYVRIQLDRKGFIALTEIELLGIGPGNGGSGEICGNGEDDDCDGRIDCEDNDCAPVIAHVTKVNPSCPTCEDGQIRVNVANKRESEVLYSIDNGSTYVEFNRAEENYPVHLFDDLGEGTYNLVVKNDICEVRYVNNPVVLAATGGILTSDCGNGDLELGDEGWYFERYRIDPGNLISSYGSDDPTMDFNPEFIEAFIIPTAGFVDPLVNEINGSWSALGTYMLQLGATGRTNFGNNTNPMFHDDRNIAEYCFDVNQENQDFSFAYAAVLDDDGNHWQSRKPFFEYELFINGGKIGGEKFVSDDDLFEDGPDDIFFKAWTCVFFDLSDHLGSNACVKFTARDCTQKGHSAYAYIDGLCTDANLINPEIEILADEVFCSDESVSLDVIGGGYSSYQWKVGKVDVNNNQYDIYEWPLQEPGYDASFSNVLSQYFLDSGFSDECVMYFAELSVSGSCGTATETVEFRRSCVDYVVDYCDDLLACTTAHDEINFEGEIDCEGCIFDWQPAYYFVDNTVALPTIKPDLVSGTNDVFDRDYFLTYTAPDGCEDMKTVTIGSDDFDISIEKVHTLCLSTYTVEITFDFEVNPSVVERIFALDARNNNFVDEGTFIFSTNNSLIYEIEVDRSRELGDIQPYYYIDFDFSSLDEVCFIGEDMTQCSKEGWLDQVNNNIFSKPWAIWMTNVFDPYHSDPGNRVFRPYFSTYIDSQNDCPGEDRYEGSSIYWAKMTIYAVNGAVVFEKEWDDLPDDATFGLTGREVQWDGVIRCGDGVPWSNYCGDDNDCDVSNGPANNPGEPQPLCSSVGDNHGGCGPTSNPDCYQFHEDGVYVWTLRIRSCTIEAFGDCGWGFPCDSEDGYYCSEERGTGEERMFSGDITILKYSENW